MNYHLPHGGQELTDEFQATRYLLFQGESIFSGHHVKMRVDGTALSGLKPLSACSKREMVSSLSGKMYAENHCHRTYRVADVGNWAFYF